MNIAHILKSNISLPLRGEVGRGFSLPYGGRLEGAVFFIFLLFTILPCHAKLSVTKLTCNFQQGLAVTHGDIHMGWQMISDANGDAQTAYQIKICENFTDKTVYDSGKTVSDQSQLVSLPNLISNNLGYYWQVRVWDSKNKSSEWSKRQNIRVAPKSLDAKWIGAITKDAARLPEGRWSNGEFSKEEFKEKWDVVDSLSSRSIIVRKEFNNDGRQVANAVVYVSGMGHYEMSINGQKIGDSEFAPVWSEYDKTVYYNTYDVTQILVSGGNAVSVLLGNGFFNVQRLGHYGKLQTSFGAPQLLLRMEISYMDGSSKTIVSDTDWKYALSPVTYNSIYGGESYDARLYQEGYDNAGFDDSRWFPVVEVEGPSGILTPQTVQPVKIMERFGIVSTSKIPADSLAAASAATKRDIDPSAFVADMGQNLAGFPEITVKGKRGQKITLVVAEKLTKQGACDQRQTGRQHYYEYTLSGDGIETWHPRFSYYGFRYIQVEGAVLEGEPNPDDLPVITDLQSCFVYNSADEVSSFECSNPLFTQTHRLIERAERSNMQSVLTDCPHREKLGWLEQDHLCGPSLLYNYDMTCYVPKVIRDITDTQKDDGMVPTIAPQYVSFGNLFDDSPEWGSTLLILPFMYYEQYGDSTLITRNYPAMRSYVDYLTSRSENGIVSHGLGDWYD
ncbi:MAG: family 78 glycoside hydrolase catalytic domain, partial [Prevotella sp.]|nr:family 78 glycoside hydrolase catalytic domain [Prevotella sp.]